ncbi:hypothetical protein A0H81_08897 [Grifola frondosa]|uniref:Uncharacterized protein n=1 Tax=Grifola frondosa TaxID=5627 RepID=A0A1C7M973_GRIFR|nr:hypothetical protein A0H81_08897 [Grifola frondosa]
MLEIGLLRMLDILACLQSYLSQERRHAWLSREEMEAKLRDAMLSDFRNVWDEYSARHGWTESTLFPESGGRAEFEALEKIEKTFDG